jgi:hypothetical protein
MKSTRKFAVLMGIILLFSLAAARAQAQQDSSSAPPDHVVKLIFIHHSTGENWLRDDYGELGKTLGQNNYFVSDTNYGWGPDGIGDRTDIPNWTEWFASEGTPRYMSALFNESGQHSDYTRALSDPGGENQIIVFKSCFPNSALEGNPNDAPNPEGWLSVGHAKYVYNEILKYFGTRPDKLFIVITAPPLSDGTYAENARAFNNWLLNDWLRENNYPGNNVAVFDFYNVLTDPNAHHRFVNGQIEHTNGTRNTLYYPSGDDHPSAQGSRKATEEFVPLLNYYYHRWAEGLPANVPQPAGQPTTTPADQATQPVSLPPLSGTSGLLDNFEAGPPAGTAGWEGYFQDNTDTRLTCAPASGNAYGGASSLKFEFDVTANSWATCGFYFDSNQNWTQGQGISFYLRADQAGLPFTVDLYGGSPGGRTTYHYQTQTPPESVDNWVLVQVRWEQILRVDWEENAGAPFNPAEVSGFSFGLAAPENSRLKGTLWVDDLSLLGAPQPAPATASAPASAPTEVPATPEPAAGRPSLPCVGSLLLPLIFSLSILLRRR